MSDHPEALRSAIVNSKPLYCAGTLPVQAEDLILLYGREDIGRLIDFSNASEDVMKQLSDTCDKATFGCNKEDVLDEAYCKAGKLDNAHFGTKVDVGRSGFMNTVRFDLLEGSESSRPVKAELYKLNVYGKDTFFKAHEDAPRSTMLFGSLVIILPTFHEGGAWLFVTIAKNRRSTLQSGSQKLASKHCRTSAMLHSSVTSSIRSHEHRDYPFGRVYHEVLVGNEVSNIDMDLDETQLCHYLAENDGGKLVNIDQRSVWLKWVDEEFDDSTSTTQIVKHEGAKTNFIVHWVTNKIDFNMKKEAYITMGNEAELVAYGRFCLTVTVGPAASRGMADKLEA